MRLRYRNLSVALLGAAAIACGGAEASSDAAQDAPSSATTPLPDAAPAAAPARSPASAGAGAGTAHVSLVGKDISVEGDFPTMTCGGPYVLGKGMSYRTRAGDWQITVASEERQTGTVPLYASDGDANVVVNVNGPGKQFVAPRGSTASVRVADDFGQLAADLELSGVVSREQARLVVTFTCGAPA